MSVPSAGCIWRGCLSLAPKLLGNSASKLMGGGGLRTSFLPTAYNLQLLCFAFPRKKEALFPSWLRGAGLLGAGTVIEVHGQESGRTAF